MPKVAEAPADKLAPALRRLKVVARATPDAGEGTFEALVSSYEETYEIGWFWKERILADCFADSIETHNGIFPVCWMHAWELGPIGDSVVKEMDAGLLANGELYLDLDPLVARLYRGMKAQAITEWSIAFYPEEITWTDEEPEVDQIVKGDLIEITSCFRGANPGTETIDLRGATVALAGGEEAARREVVRLRSLSGRADFGSTDRMPGAARPPDGARSRKAEPVHHTGTSDASWDAGANEKNMSNDDGAEEYSKAYAWVDPDGDPDTKAAYSFPHHFVDSEGKVGDASTVACSNGIGRLNGGGTSDAWWDDRAGVHAHLAAHLTDAGEEPPALDAADAPKQDSKPVLAGILRSLRSLGRKADRARRASTKKLTAAPASLRSLKRRVAAGEDVDPGELAQALDAVIDEIAEALEAGDLDGATDLATAADSTADDLLEALGVADDDELEDDEGAEASMDSATAAQLLSSRVGRELLARVASGPPPS